MRTRTWLGITSLFLGLTAFMTWPMFAHPFTRIVGWPGDNLYFVWLTEWYRKAIFELHQWPLRVETLNSPEGWNLAYNEMTPAMALLGAPGWPISPAAAYNVSMVASFVLTGVFTALWVKRIGGSTPGAILAGTAFAFAPYRTAHFHGHLNLMGTQWLPLFFLAVTNLMTAPDRSVRRAAAVAASLALIAATSQYYLYFSVLAAVPLAWVLARSRPVRWYRDSVLFQRVLLAGAMAAPLVWAFVYPYFSLSHEGVLGSRSLSEVQVWSAGLQDYVLPSRHSAWFGRWVNSHFDRTLGAENTLQLSFAMVALASVALVRVRTPIVRAITWATVLAFVLSLGTELRWLGNIVDVKFPPWLQLWIEIDHTTIPLPGRWLYEHLPFYGSMRVWMRWGAFVALFVSVLGGLGFSALTQRLRPRTTAVLTTAVMLCVLFEFRPAPFEMTPAQPRPADSWLAAQPGADRVAVFPVDRMGSPESTFYSRYWDKPFVGASFAAFLSPQFKRIRPTLGGFPDETSVTTLRQLGVRWVLVELDKYPDGGAVLAGAAKLGMRRAYLQGSEAVFELE